MASYTIGGPDSTGKFYIVQKREDGYQSMDMSVAMNDVMDFFDYMYRSVGIVDSRVYRPHHVEIRSIYAHLAGRFPDATMADCFDLVQDVLEFTNTDSSVYPYPDGREWTDAEIKKYVEWRNRNEQSN